MDGRFYDALPCANKFFVGDDDQSVYAFRGSNQRYMLDLSRRPGVTVLELGQNYRCSEAVCRAANALISHNSNRTQKAPMQSASGEPGRVTKTVYDNEAEELGGIIKAIKQHCGNVAEYPSTGSPVVIHPSDIVILLRTNALVMQFTEALAAAGVPVAQKQRIELPPDWPLATAFAAMLGNPENDFLAARFLGLRLGPERTAALQARARDAYVSLIEISQMPIRNAMLSDVPDMMVAAGIGRESVKRMREVMTGLPPDATLPELQYALGERQQTEEQVQQGVRVTTIHAAKGTEAEVVFLPCLEQGVLPMGKQPDLEEERRLLFVGITRAKRACYLSRSLTRCLPFSTGPAAMAPSCFWEEI